MIKPNISEMAVRKSRHFLLSWDFILPVILLVLGTIIFRHTNLDLIIQSRYYLPIGGWAFNTSLIPGLIYKYGNLPALLVSIGSLIVYVLSYSRSRFLPYRKISIYLVLAFIIGPGILVNSILKDNWGRPRPRDVIQYGGNYAYEEPLTYDSSSPGKSFPCGHATMGFYFFAVALVLRQNRRLTASLVLIASAFWGIIIGWVRIGQGGHFASDVLWAGCLVYLCSFLLYRTLSLQKQIYYLPDPTQALKKLKPHHKLAFLFLGAIIIMGVMLATPYSSKAVYKISEELTTSNSNRIMLNLKKADLLIEMTDHSNFSYSANGFGFPGSKLKSHHSYTDSIFSFSQKTKGLFTELNCEAKLELDFLHTRHLSTKIKQGKARIFVPLAYTDTIFISPSTKLLANSVKHPVAALNQEPENGLWFDVPSLTIETIPISQRK